MAIIKKTDFATEKNWYDFLKSLGYQWCSETKWMNEVNVEINKKGEK